MPWFKVDDNLAFHAKTVAAGNAAIGLWVRAGAWSANTLTEGFIPNHMISAFNGGKLVSQLVACGLWERVDGGYQFHDWHGYQPSKASVEAEREAARERQRRARERAKLGRDAPPSPPKGHAVTNGVTHPAVTVPPSHPVPTLQENKRTPADADARFEEFWNAFNHKFGKQRARDNWDKAIKKTDPQEIIAGARRYAEFVAAALVRDPGFKVKWAEGWLTERRWEDELKTEKPDEKQNGFFSPPPPPPEMPREFFTRWNRAHHQAHLAGRPGPVDWRELEAVS